MEMMKLVNDYLEQKQFKALSTEESKGMCDYYSKDISSYLNANGINAEVIEGIGYIPPLHKQAHEDWQAFRGKDQKFLAHVVVKVDNTIIDLTGAQFNPDHKSRILYSLDTFKSEWKTIKTPKALNN
jgi:hypothetical protein